MCGILVFSNGAFDNDEELHVLRRDIAARGPNHWGSVEAHGLHFEASVLSLRDPFTPQPVVTNKPDSTVQDVLCFNGQIYDLPEGIAQDTLFFQSICWQSVREVQSVEGEFAFTYFDQKNQILYFGRDRLGRRSLLYKITDSGELIVSSVAGSSDGFIECEGQNVLYSYSLATKRLETFEASSAPFRVSRELDAGSFSPSSGLELLRAAVAKRLVRLQSMRHESIAVLFSGGIDCTIIAALLDDLLPDDVTVDLLNVAFENRRAGTMWETPDRLLARRSLDELNERSSNSRRFRLVEINVPYEVACEHTETVKRLMYPNSTVMDLSIALAFYFAARPQDSLSHNSEILISGLGADELFAGYSRHLGSARDTEKLAKELELDLNRLPHRNLGRDDRVCAAWGREMRYPFLDKDVVEYAARLPLNLKTDGKTTKIALRAMARSIGLTAVCDEKKRAIQFGARSAKMDPGSGNLKGHNAL